VKGNGLTLALLVGAAAFAVWAWVKSQEQGEPQLLDTLRDYGGASAEIAGNTLGHLTTSAQDAGSTLTAPVTALVGGGSDRGIGDVIRGLFS
jgi:hypothetical protein